MMFHMNYMSLALGDMGLALANEYTGIVNNDRVDNHMGKWFPLFLEWLTDLNLI